MKILPIGVQSFERIRKKGMLYVDKTARLLELICQGAGRYFLSRPRRFGKSLTVATLEAMFQGRAELFQGMAAESWVAGQTAHPRTISGAIRAAACQTTPVWNARAAEH